MTNVQAQINADISNKEEPTFADNLKSIPKVVRRIFGILTLIVIALLYSAFTSEDTDSSNNEDLLANAELNVLKYQEQANWEIKYLVYQNDQVLKAKKILQSTKEGISIALSPENHIAVDCNVKPEYEKAFTYKNTNVTAKVSCRKMNV